MGDGTHDLDGYVWDAILKRSNKEKIQSCVDRTTYMVADMAMASNFR